MYTYKYSSCIETTLTPRTNQVKAKVEEMDLPVTFHDAIDHAELGKFRVRTTFFFPRPGFP